jgi:hypothetical protein
MPLSIGRVETELDLSGTRGASRPEAASPAATTREQQLAMLRPLVLEILEDELERINRRHGAAR